MEPAAQGNFATACTRGLASLSFASGCTDVLTFLKLGNVFTSAMTGNAALFAAEIARGRLFGALHALTALLSFALGVALAAKVSRAWLESLGQLSRFSRLLVLELVFLIGCVTLWSLSLDPVQGARVYAIIFLSALSMGIQAVAAHSLSSAINTIVFTSVLVRIVMSMTDALSRRNGPAVPGEVNPLLLTFAAYGGGALLGAILAGYLAGPAIWLPALAVLVALGIAQAAIGNNAQPRAYWG
jgi:uncharacterized membrane protein YoaK (UPF0700 family)